MGSRDNSATLIAADAARMLADVAWRTLQILFFRAGPEDFPYDARLTWTLPAIAIVGNGAFMALVLPPATSIAIGAAMVGVLALYTRAVLRTRNMLNRFQQTFNALLATDLVLKAAMMPAFYVLAPKLAALVEHPELLNDPNQLVMPAGPVLVTNLITYWSFAVSANIFRHAVDVSILVGVLIAFIAVMFLLFGTGLASGIVKAIGG